MNIEEERRILCEGNPTIGKVTIEDLDRAKKVPVVMGRENPSGYDPDKVRVYALLATRTLFDRTSIDNAVAVLAQNTICNGGHPDLPDKCQLKGTCKELRAIEWYLQAPRNATCWLQTEANKNNANCLRFLDQSATG